MNLSDRKRGQRVDHSRGGDEYLNVLFLSNRSVSVNTLYCVLCSQAANISLTLIVRDDSTFT